MNRDLKMLQTRQGTSTPLLYNFWKNENLQSLTTTVIENINLSFITNLSLHIMIMKNKERKIDKVSYYKYLFRENRQHSFFKQLRFDRRRISS